MSRTTSIGELAALGALQFGDGYRTKRSEHGQPGYRIIRVADVVDNAVSFEGPDFVSADYTRAIGTKLGHPGDILLTTKGTVGRVAVLPEIDEQVVYSPQLCYFRVVDSEVVNPRFLRYWFSSREFWDQAADRMNNTDMAAYINLADIRSLKMTLPSIPSQQAIAEVLGALDNKIAANTKLAATSMRLAETYFRRTVHLATDERALGEILSLEYGKSLPTSSRVAGLTDVYGSGGITGSHNEALCPEPGVVVGRKGTAGAVHWSHRPFFPIDTTFYVVPSHHAVSQVFCYFLLRTLGLDEMNNDSAVPGLNRNQAHASRIMLPSEAALDEFTSLATKNFSTAAQAERENSTLMLTRDALLPQLMSGKLRVKDAEALVAAAV